MGDVHDSVASPGDGRLGRGHERPRHGATAQLGGVGEEHPAGVVDHRGDMAVKHYSLARPSTRPGRREMNGGVGFRSFPDIRNDETTDQATHPAEIV